MPTRVYFDLETQKTANDVGGWERKDLMRMSVGVTFNTSLQKYTVYPEERADDLIAELRRADVVIGYNIAKFDYGVLMGYTILDLCEQVTTLDLLLDLEQKLGFRMKLESVAQATLGIGKTAEGLDAIRWWREGRFVDVARYCCFDVKVTKLVHEFGMEHGKVWYFDRNGRRQEVAVDWK